MVKHKSKYSCKCVIYFELGPDNKKLKCKFACYFNITTINPRVLDGGNENIIAN